eukprot:CAMPEP_0201587230 /NCGR_PEP_ID=MMETSP0190_2-20130828/141689_1 /ASSEMBLY_ACC=CAM_ASM_000263 /TAXON_ID=37353 /ORGANISM="Rosalina sp." /LENGTH=77 /DNA_ID=CAMNT_0048036863 /DNA_START=292 /DNA_END=522 /DNA_ORIENTATION=-
MSIVNTPFSPIRESPTTSSPFSPIPSITPIRGSPIKGSSNDITDEKQKLWKLRDSIIRMDPLSDDDTADDDQNVAEM